MCVINFSHGFQETFFRPCVHCVVVMEVRMWRFDGDKINFDRITAF